MNVQDEAMAEQAGMFKTLQDERKRLDEQVSPLGEEVTALRLVNEQLRVAKSAAVSRRDAAEKAGKVWFHASASGTAREVD